MKFKKNKYQFLCLHFKWMWGWESRCSRYPVFNMTNANVWACCGLCFFKFFTTKSPKKSIRKTKPAILVIRRICQYNICIHICLFGLQSKIVCTYSLLNLSLESINLRLRVINNFKHIQPVKACTSSRRFTILGMHSLTILN